MNKFKRYISILAVIAMVVAFGIPAMADDAGWRLATYDSAGAVGINFAVAGPVSGHQFVLDSLNTGAISATAGATVEMFALSSGSVITSGANSAGATTVVGTAASSASAFWNTTISAGDLVVYKSATYSDPNDDVWYAAEFVSGSTVTGTVKGLSGAIPDGSTLYRFVPVTGNLAFEAPTVSKPIFIDGGDNQLADFTGTNYSQFPGKGLAGRVSEGTLFETYSGVSTTSPAIYLRGHYVPYK